MEGLLCSLQGKTHGIYAIASFCDVDIIWLHCVRHAISCVMCMSHRLTHCCHSPFIVYVEHKSFVAVFSCNLIIIFYLSQFLLLAEIQIAFFFSQYFPKSVSQIDIVDWYSRLIWLVLWKKKQRIRKCFVLCQASSKHSCFKVCKNPLYRTDIFAQFLSILIYCYVIF